MPYYHLTARAHRPLQPFSNRDICAMAWARLRKRFDSALACVLMPNHLHLLLELAAQDLNTTLRSLSTELVVLSKISYPGHSVWEPLPPAELIPDKLQLKRQIRYVHLNPCRSGLASDPLEWEWSTHRDAIGAVERPWVNSVELARILEIPSKNFTEAFHAYVSGDPSVRVEGTRLPATLVSQNWIGSLEQVTQATLQVTHAAKSALKSRSPTRRRCILLADYLGNYSQDELANQLGVSDRAIRKALAQPPTSSERAFIQTASWLLSDFGRFQPRPKFQKAEFNPRSIGATRPQVPLFGTS